MANEKKLATRFLFIDKGDPSVGIDGQSVVIEYQGSFYNEDTQKEFVEAVKGGLAEVMDIDHVIYEHEHTCRHCNTKFMHLDDWCEDVCDKAVCRKAEADQEYQAREEAERQQYEADALAMTEDASTRYTDFDKDYFRERNERILSRINGAGVRC